MADAATIARLRRNIADEIRDGYTPAYDDADLSALLGEADGIEPRARVAALLPLWTEAASRTDYSAGTGSEKASQYFTQLGQLLAGAQSEVAALDAASAVASQPQAVTQSIATQVVF